MGSELLVETLLAALLAIGLYIARETNKHSLYLFGAGHAGRRGGVAADLEEVKDWKAKLSVDINNLVEEVSSLRESNAALVREVRRLSSNGYGGGTPSGGGNGTPPQKRNNNQRRKPS